MDYPVWNVAFGGGVLMAVVAIAHVVVAHFAIGGGMVIVTAEALAVRRADPGLRELARRSSLVLILLSTVFGAISGVGIWVVAGLISPGAISALIQEFVWGWAIEWTFFLVEIVAALLYYTTWSRITRRAHLAIGWVYVGSAFLSLVVINGIVTFMLTPGRWLETGAFWDGFFNPTYWPSLVLRTGICAMMAAAVMLLVVQRAGREERPRLARFLGWWMTAGAVLAYGGYRWWEAALPDHVVALFRGSVPLLETLAATRSLTLWALAAALLLGGVLMVAWPRAGRTAPAIAVVVAVVAFFGGYERLREGVRKPFLIHGSVFSNGLRVGDIEAVNRDGVIAYTGWILARAGENPSPEVLGEQLFRQQCASCHTLDGYQAVRPLLPSAADMVAVAADDPPGAGAVAYGAGCAGCHPDITSEEMRDMLPAAEDLRADLDFTREFAEGMVVATLEAMREMGDAYLEAGPGVPPDAGSLRWPTMPPLVGSDEEIAALAAYLSSITEPAVTRPDRVAGLGGGR